ncbi:LacI family DNA-binding transcriptional regulator [Paracoccus sp. 1_MG-2023]|uniref:LacI family DNA-binding transcriptional regulator n=1 Tax=unclassified Paracoccus (in: a-proteobacteria) TaxID=2688777 RepID=UPI001C092B16|nr:MULTISPECIES: LacI family DNA-binding transcriptional regulator [unclassified Paracoccus (in: a-proteobacteria)]MBU2956062.1 LacI family DNA-binding transcriptional regulator [Paracoccus sp. C2R09]MDO6669468.1 LacI family DNA-binding transcriptional regulator [Paracoccus sp. 1_MG-2023]
MAEKPTLETVAQEAGVSVPTVSQVMRGTGRISEQTRKKVLQAAKKLYYVPNSRAASMRSGENKEIGFVINMLANPFNAEVVSGAVEVLEAEGYLVSILDAEDDAERQRRHLEAFIRHGRGGLLWVPALETGQDTIDLLAAHRIPSVSFLRPASERFDHVGIRNAEATTTATRHLVDLGHRRIAYMGGSGMSHVRRERLAGYGRVIEDIGGRPVIWPSPDGRVAGMEAMRGLRAAHPDVTAVVCNGDMIALGACHALNRDGLLPGRDMSVIGFDDIEEAALAMPPLTTMTVSPRKLGRKLARVLLERIADPDMPPAVTEVPARLEIRGTCGPVPRDA